MIKPLISMLFKSLQILPYQVYTQTDRYCSATIESKVSNFTIFQFQTLQKYVLKWTSTPSLPKLNGSRRPSDEILQQERNLVRELKTKGRKWRQCWLKDSHYNPRMPNIDAVNSDTDTLRTRYEHTQKQCVGVAIEDIDIWYMGIITNNKITIHSLSNRRNFLSETDSGLTLNHYFQMFNDKTGSEIIKCYWLLRIIITVRSSAKMGRGQVSL